MKTPELSKEALLEAIFGIPHLTSEQIKQFNSNEFEPPYLGKIFLHLAECRICRKLVCPLSVSDFRAALSPKFRDDYIEEQYQNYLDPDPPPFYDEKISWREKFWRLYKYRDNYFFNMPDFEGWWLKLRRRITQITRGIKG